MSLYTNLAEADLQRTFHGDPLDLLSSKLVPEDRDEAFELAEEIWKVIGMYRMGLLRVIRYFLTEVEFPNTDYEETRRWDKLINKVLDFPTVLSLIGTDLMVYGNSITSIYTPFIRFLKCPKCGVTLKSEGLDYQYRNGKYHCTCKECKFTGAFKRIDKKDPDPTKLNIIRWDPSQISIEHLSITGHTKIYWEPTNEVIKAVSGGDKFYLDHLPFEIIQCAESKTKVLLNPKLTKHLKLESLAGIDTEGWGTPPVLSNFGSIWFIQMLRKFNEAVALDYLVPLRILTPVPPTGTGGTGADPIMDILSTPNFTEKVLEMVEDRRKNPTNWYALPFPVHYGPVGGEGVDMLRPDLLNYAEENLLNSMGVPVEFYRGNMQTQSTPTTLRQLEKTWEFFVSAINNWIDWSTDIIALVTGWEPVEAGLKPVEIIEDIARKQLLLQLAFQGDISRQTAFEPWYIDLREELDKRMQEEDWLAQKMQDAQERQAAKQEMGQMGGAPPGPMGPPPAPGGPGGQGATIADLHRRAAQIAQQLIASDETTRSSTLIELSKQDPTLHALVKTYLEDIRQQTNTQGGAMLRQQMF